MYVRTLTKLLDTNTTGSIVVCRALASVSAANSNSNNKICPPLTGPSDNPSGASQATRALVISSRRSSSLSPFVPLSIRRLSTINSNRYHNQIATANEPLGQTIDYRIVKHHDWSHRLAKVESLIAHTNIELNDLEVSLDNGHSSSVRFNLTWLRDSCHCDKCTHPHSRQRLFTSHDFRKHNFQVKQVRVAQEGTLLNVVWLDGHSSLYSMSWLKKCAAMFGEPGERTNLDLAGARQRPVFELPADGLYAPIVVAPREAKAWAAHEIGLQLEPIEFADLVAGVEFDPSLLARPSFNQDVAEWPVTRKLAVQSLTSQLLKHGLAKIVNTPVERDQVLRLARSLAYERPTGYGVVFDVLVESASGINLAYSSLEFDLHVDLAYRELSPGVNILHCIQDSSAGGHSYFTDGLQVAEQMRCDHPHLFEALVQFPAVFLVHDPYRRVNMRRQTPVIGLDHVGRVAQINYGPFMQPPVGHADDVKLFYLAMEQFTRGAQATANKYVTKMAPGDVFMMNNRRLLHGRSAYDSSKERRHLQGLYMDWDEIESLHEKVHL